MGRLHGRRVLRWVWRATVASLLAGVAVVVWQQVVSRRRERGETVAAEPAVWPPFEPRASAADPPAWVAPVDGACPPGYPVKANERSGIYHVPGGRFYERTRPDRCYAEAAAAEADGYRRAKA